METSTGQPVNTLPVEIKQFTDLALVRDRRKGAKMRPADTNSHEAEPSECCNCICATCVQCVYCQG